MVKELLSWLLMLTMAALSCTGVCESAGEGDMPDVGGVVCGFELQEIRDFSIIGAEIYRFVHRRTGAELFYIKNDDTNRVFDLVFRTQAIDNTGLPHVFEHATLAGSRKYPSKDLWFNLSNGSYNTFMNAYTATTHTAYPVASLSEKQLLKFADFYTDCCLNPMVMEDESIFREEAWRYRLNAPEEELTLEGTVYSEMRGAMTLDQWAITHAERQLMRGAYAGNISGGDPAEIPNMTYEALRSYHDTYYHPSNCVIYLYGKLDGYADFLALLDEAFAPFERRDMSSLFDLDAMPIHQPVEADYAYPVEAGAETENASVITYSVVLPGLKEDPEALIKLNSLGIMLNDESSPLDQAMEAAFPDAGWGCSLLLHTPEPVFMFTLSNCDIGDKPAFKRIVDEALHTVVEAPFSRDITDNLAAQLEIAKRLTGESSEIGINVLEALSTGYMDSGDPYMLLEKQDALDSMKRWNEEGVYGEIAQKYLIDAQRTALCCVYPAPGEKEKADAALHDRLQEIKAQMDDAEIEAIVEMSNAPAQTNPKTEDMLKALTAVDVKSLPEEIRTYDYTDITDDGGTRHIDVTADVAGIGIPVLMLDIADLPQEDIHWFHLFVELTGELDSKTHTHDQLDTLWDRYLNSGDISLYLIWQEDGSFRPCLRMDWISLDEDIEAAYDLMYEMVFEIIFEDIQRIKDMVSVSINGFRDSVNAYSYAYQAARMLGVNVPMERFSSYYGYVEYYDFLKSVMEMLNANPEAVTQKLCEMQIFAMNGAGAISAYAGGGTGIPLNRSAADAFIKKLNRRKVIPATYDLPTPAQREALIVDSAVQYNGIVLDFESLDTDYAPELDVVMQIVNDLYLLPELRTRYGAYGSIHEPMTDMGLCLYSYRDPNVDKTFQVYEGLPDFLETLKVDREMLDRYILSVYQGYAMPVGELSGAVATIENIIEDIDPEQLIEDMRSLKAMTPETVMEYREMYKTLIEQGTRFTTGGAAAINGAGEIYDVVLNPFGAQDKSRQDFSDVTRDRADYKLLRYVYEEGFMEPLSETTFGVDEPARYGNLCYALGQLISETKQTPEEAVKTLQAYGILPPEADAADMLTAAACEDILVAFSDSIGVPYPGGMAGNAEPNTRADLAATISEYMQWLDGLEAEAA